MTNREFLKGVTVGALLTGALTVGGFTGWMKASASDSVVSDKSTKAKLEYLEKIIDANYLEEKDEEALAEGLYTGLLYGLGDPYSRYYTEEEYDRENKENEGSYSGIGVVITENSEGGILVTECYEGGPAELAGMEAGDVISAVDGEDITEKTTAQVSQMIKNDEDGNVVLTIHRTDVEEPLEITVSVTDVELPTIYSDMLEDHVGYLRISEFAMVTPKQFEEQFGGLQEMGMEKLVIDLRYNPGGVLSSVCGVLEQILPEGMIVYMEDKYGNRQEHTCEGKTPLEIPLSVLVNEESASAAEVFAGAVQDYGIGTIVGTTTYGKGIVQTIIPLSDGSAVKLTTAKYYTPNGNDIHEVGIKPDVEVKLDTSLLNKENISREDDNQLQAALKALGE
ncbi:S41 family peptidase [Ruminococcus sp. 5_1_39BFAA]|uniref:S41 family peptidase n=1 Tax=Ruminococcus sp. 5_1_39BFAA TaxID=457412 RepID=UPI00356323B6